MKITIKAARINAGMKQSDVAKECNTSVQTVNAWEKDPSRIKISTAYKLSELYAVPIDDLIFEP